MMLRQTAWSLALVVCCLIFNGCSNSDEPTQNNSSAGNTPTVAIGTGSAEHNLAALPGGQSAPQVQNQATSPAQIPNFALPSQQQIPVAQISADASPEEVVSTFLKSLCAGDETMTAGLLTDVARQETAKQGLVIQPIGSPDAKYQVQKAQYLPNQPSGVHVNSVWTETDQNGEQISFEAIWALRRQKNGWRIAGMAIQLEPGQPPQFFNFEQPESLVQQLQKNNEEPSAGPQGQSQAPQQATLPKQQGSTGTIQR